MMNGPGGRCTIDVTATLPGEMLGIACKPFRYHVLGAEMGLWLPVHGGILNYKGISQQLCLIPTFPIEQLDVTFDDARDQLELEHRQ
jgi:hypothetical protein